jgi:trimethylamine--corrinoid protein Co-methyltransferase
MWEGISVDDEHLALDVTKSVGPKGSYIAEKHTAKHCRDNHWNSRYFGAQLPLRSRLVPDRDLIERIDDDLRKILANHRPEALPEPIQKKLHAILERFEAA